MGRIRLTDKVNEGQVCKQSVIRNIRQLNKTPVDLRAGIIRSHNGRLDQGRAVHTTDDREVQRAIRKPYPRTVDKARDRDLQTLSLGWEWNRNITGDGLWNSTSGLWEVVEGAGCRQHDDFAAARLHARNVGVCVVAGEVVDEGKT